MPTVTAANPSPDPAVATAAHVLDRLDDPDALEAAVRRSTRDTTFPRRPWQAGTLSSGFAGLAVAAASRGGPLSRGRRHLEAAVTATGVGTGLYSGAAGLGAAALLLRREGRGAESFLRYVDRVVAQRAATGAARLRGPISAADWDLVSGLTGTAVYLLLRGTPTTPVRRQVLDTLVAMILDPADPPRWATPSHLLATDDQRAAYPDGHLNCGLAHGLAGVVALLALALRDGVEVPGTRPALASAALWLADQRCDDGGPRWPDAIPLTEDGQPGEPRWLARDAWCYGTAGVCRALFLAGGVLEDAALQQAGLHGLRAAVLRAPADRRTTSVTLCHGVAGLLLVIARTAAETGDPVLRRGRDELLTEVMAAYDDNRLLGWVDTEPSGAKVDVPGLLDGAAGVALAVLSACSEEPLPWERLLLIS